MTSGRLERDETPDEIRKIWLESLGIELPADESDGVDKLQDLSGVDSVALLEFVVALEQRFGITVEPEWLKLDRLTDVPALADYIRQRSASSRTPPVEGR